MDEREKAIVTAYTGISMLQGEGLESFYKYVDELFGRPVYTHEFFILADEIKKRSRDDFIALCRKTEPEQRWIPVSERLPEENKNVLVTVFFKGWINHIKPKYYVESASQIDGEWISNSAVYKIAKSQH